MLWFPYTQMKNNNEFPLVVKCKGVKIYLENGKVLIDGLSSWWSVIHGYNHPKLNKALIQQVNKFSHVMLGGLSHKPAEKLAAKLVEITPKDLNHVFFSDSGSVGVEVALKMAVQYWANKGQLEKTKFVSLKNSYHGDTFKAMEISDDSDFVSAFSHMLNKGFVVSPPLQNFQSNDSKKELKEVETLFKKHADEIAAFILEPIVQCAGGFNFYTPNYLNGLKELCNKYNVLLIFDEVATGFGRTGKLFATDHTNISPDILILGKGLTAGYVGHAATLASSRVFSTFLGDNHESAFMHGPTFMANALACSVALESIALFEKNNYLKKISFIEKVIHQEFSKLESKYIKNKRVLGAIGVIEVKQKKSLKGFSEFAYANNIWLRPIGNVLYLMPSYTIKEKELLKILDVMTQWFNKLK